MSRRRTLTLIFFSLLVLSISMLYRNSILLSPVRRVFNWKYNPLQHMSPMSTSSSAMPERPVIVVGSGLAGLSAAYSALRSGAPAVRMLDRAPKPGGNSIKASSGINGAGTSFQRAAGIPKDESFYPDTVHSAGKRYTSGSENGRLLPREELVRILTGESAGAVNWLVEDIGVDLSVVAQLGGHSLPRTHRGAGKTPPGAALVFGLLGKLKEDPAFTLVGEAEVNTLLVEGDAVKGVQYTHDGQEKTVQGAVVFATGGFAGDAHGLLSRYRPDLKGMPATAEARPGTHDILATAGAELVDMNSVQIHPTGFVDPAAPSSLSKFLAAEMLRGEGGILLGPGGTRFINEMQTRDIVSQAIMEMPTTHDAEGTRQWDITILLDPGACESAEGHLGFYTWKGLMKRVRVSELPEEQIKAVDEYAAMVADGRPDPLGRTAFGRWRLAPGEANRDEEVCVGKVTPVVHFTMGGVAIDVNGSVLKAGQGGELTPIPGLFAAGEITGGIHGDNRLGGSSLLECAVFGRRAGKSAAEYKGSA